MSPSILEVVASDHHDDHHDDQNGWLDSILALDQKASHLVPDDQMFLTAAVSLKNQVVDATWKGKDWREVESVSMDPTVYTGLMGTAFTCLCSYEVTGSRQDLLLCADIVNTCAAFAHNTRDGGVDSLNQSPTFLHTALLHAGKPGVLPQDLNPWWKEEKMVFLATEAMTQSTLANYE